MKKTLFAILMLLLPVAAAAGSGVLDDYINEALESNLALKQHDFAYTKARAALTEARGLFLPSVSLDARYTRAGGGRTIDVPVGDLINPIHQALNDLLGEPAFPGNLPNMDISFLREKEQETKIHVTQPVFQPSIYFNYRVRSQLGSAEKAARDAYAQDLVKDVKTAYFNYLKTLKVVELYEKTEVLLTENLRVSQSLVDNGKATADVVFRARAELSQLEQEKVEAQNRRDLARSYFNLLLNRPFDQSVEIEDFSAPPRVTPADLSDLQAQAVENRYDIEQLRMGIQAARSGVRLAQSGFLPGVVFALDYGYQGEDYSFGEDQDFWTGSVVLEWNIFDGLQRESRISQARADERRLKARLEEATKAVSLGVKEAYDNLGVADKSLQAAHDRLASAQKSFDIVEKKYAEGTAAQIEYLDARTTMTQAEINLIVTTYDYHIRQAEFEQVMGAYPVRGRLE